MIRIVMVFMLSAFTSFALTPQEERQILKDIAEIKATVQQLNARFEDMNKRIEDVNKRIEDVNKRIEDVNRRVDDLVNFMWILAGVFSAITAVTIGFALWDRRTMIRPFEDKTKTMEKEMIEDREKVQRLIEALRELAKDDDRVAKVLKHMNLI